MNPLTKRPCPTDTPEVSAAKRARLNPTAPTEPEPQPDHQVPELLELEALSRTVAGLRAPGLEEREWVGAHEFRVLADVQQDTHEVHILARGEALKTSGVATCHALCAVSTTADGRTIAGISHTALVQPNMNRQQAAAHEVQALLDAMTEEGATGPVGLYVAGGQVSLLRDVSTTPPTPVRGSVSAGASLIAAAGDRLVSARIGLSESELMPGHFLAASRMEMIVPSTGRPECVSVYVTHDSVFYVDDFNDDCNADEGDSSDDDDDVADGRGVADALRVADGRGVADAARANEGDVGNEVQARNDEARREQALEQVRIHYTALPSALSWFDPMH